MKRIMMSGVVAMSAVLFAADAAQAQWGPRVPGGGFGPGVGVSPGRHYGFPGGTSFNPYSGSLYRPWAGTVTKPSGNYFYVPGTGSYTPWGRVPGTGVYQNPWSGNLYNPRSGLYLRNW